MNTTHGLRLCLTQSITDHKFTSIEELPGKEDCKVNNESIMFILHQGFEKPLKRTIQILDSMHTYFVVVVVFI